MNYIRKATVHDLSRIAEIVVFNYRLNFYPIFKNDEFYFNELQVAKLSKQYENIVENMWVYDDGVIKGIIEIDNKEVKKLFVEPILQGNSIGSKLLQNAIDNHNVDHLWVLEKNIRAIFFYESHGFHVTPIKKLEEGTKEYLILLKR